MTENDNDKYPTWKRICAVLGTVLLILTGFFFGDFIRDTKANLQTLSITKAEKTDVQEIKGDIKEIQKDLKTLIARRWWK